MRLSQVFILTLLLGAIAAGVSAEDRMDGALVGKVSASEQPLSTARVYAYQASDLELRKVLTDRNGVFFFQSLPAGLYKVIALKPGFLPAVVMLTRTTAEATQFLEVELSRESSDPQVAEASFWKIREQIPSDVLRDLDQPLYLAADEPSSSPGRNISLTTEMQAVSGIHEAIDVGEAQVNGALVGLEGQIHNVGIDFSGEFSEVDSSGFGSGRPTGSSQALLLAIEPSDRSRVAVTSQASNLVSFRGDAPSTVDFERHRLSWSQAIGQTRVSS